MRLKSIELTANITWSPSAQHPVYLATGTAAHQLDATFSTVSSINVYRLDLSDRSSSMPLVGTVQTEERYNQLIWGGYGMESGDPSSGVVVSAGDHGHLCVWDASQLCSETPGLEACIVKKKEHAAAVNALDFNAFQPNLLASGGADSEIYIWDLDKMEAPMTPGSKSQPPEDVLCLAWNRKVQHILASTFSNRCVVWDLRKNEPIIKVSDGMSRMKCKRVAWHPGVATQMCLSSEDDHTPFIQLWDLRFATSPVQSMEQHSKGILAMAWCPKDPNILLSCGKDNQMICWNPNAAQSGGEIIYQAQLPSQWVFDVDWCPRNPGLIAASSFDGHVSLYSLMGGTSRPERIRHAVSESFGESEDPFAQPPPPASQDAALHMGSLLRAPAWMRPTCGARFAFGGKLISWGDAGSGSSRPESGSGGDGGSPEAPRRQLFVSRVVTEPELMERAQALDAVVQDSKFDEFCTMKAENCEPEIEKDIWHFLKSSFSSDARNKYRELLGYSKEDDLVTLTLKKFKEEESSEAEQKDEDSAAFDSVAASEPLTRSLHCLRLDPTATAEDGDVEGSVESALATALITGRLEMAVEICLNDNRHGEALILAVSGGAALYRRAQERVLQRLASDAVNERSAAVARLIRAVVARDWSSVADLCGRRHWRAALACVLTYATAEELGALCERIGAILEAGDDASAALNACLCYICAGNADRLVTCWMQHQGSDSSPLDLQAVVDKVVVLQHALKSTGAAGDGRSGADATGPATAAQLGRYASLLAGQGMLDVALHYLGDAQEEQLLLLRDQIYHGMASPPADVPVPPSPFPNAAGAATASKSANRLPGHVASGGAGAKQSRGLPSMHTNPSAGQPHVSMYQPNATPTNSMYQPNATPTNMYQPSGGPPTNMYQPSGGPPSNMYQPSGGPPNNMHQPSTAPPNKMFTPAPTNAPTPPPPSGQAPPPPSSSAAMAPSSVLRTGRVSSAGWNDPPPRKERSKADLHIGPTDQDLSTPAVNNFYNPAAYMPDPSSAPPLNRFPGPTAPVASQPSGHGAYNPYGGGLVSAPQPQPATYAPPNFYKPAAPTQPAEASTSAPPPPQAPQPKAPLPQEHQLIEQVLNELLSLCKMGATSRQMKMKMDDVGRKLEALYDSIRQDSISPTVLSGVHNIVSAVRIADYTMAIAIINQIVETSNFAEIRAFVPGLKVLMQSASMMNVQVS